MFLDVEAYLRKWVGCGRMGGVLIRTEHRSHRAPEPIFSYLSNKFQSNRISMRAWVRSMFLTVRFRDDGASYHLGWYPDNMPVAGQD